MPYENNEQKIESVYSKRIRAGKRRTYFFDVRATRSNDYFLTITESRKRFNDNGYDRHKIFLYKEDFNKFIKALTEAVDYVKTDLMPDFDFDAFNHDNYEENGGAEGAAFVQATSNGTVEQTAEIAESLDTPETTKAPEGPVEEEEKQEEVFPITAANDHSTEEVDKW